MEEIFKDINNYENYQVSNFGNVRNKITKKIIKSFLHNGYLVLKMYKNKKPKTFLVHRIVAETFLHNPLNKKEVNHKNKIRNDNNISNLEWVTRQENSNHKFGKQNIDWDILIKKIKNLVPFK